MEVNLTLSFLRRYHWLSSCKSLIQKVYSWTQDPIFRIVHLELIIKPQPECNCQVQSFFICGGYGISNRMWRMSLNENCSWLNVVASTMELEYLHINFALPETKGSELDMLHVVPMKFIYLLPIVPNFFQDW